jgi:hypothetical protein
MQQIELVVHTITMGDVDDPDLFVADPIWRWQQTEEGQWIMEHSQQQPEWRRSTCPVSWGWKYDIVAWLSEPDYTYWKLKHG